MVGRSVGRWQSQQSVCCRPLMRVFRALLSRMSDCVLDKRMALVVSSRLQMWHQTIGVPKQERERRGHSYKRCRRRSFGLISPVQRMRSSRRGAPYLPCGRNSPAKAPNFQCIHTHLSLTFLQHPDFGGYSPKFCEHTPITPSPSPTLYEKNGPSPGLSNVLTSMMTG